MPLLFSFKNELSKFSYSVRPNEDESKVVLHWHLMDKMPFSEYRDNHNVHNMPTALFLYLREYILKSDFGLTFFICVWKLILNVRKELLAYYSWPNVDSSSFGPND